MAAIAVCECGWRSHRMTAARAAYSGRRHSCERQVRRVAMAERVAARRAADGPRVDCTHPQATHEHGTHAAYVLDRCRCRACRDAASRYERWRGKQRAYGREAYVSADRARAHVTALRDAGMGLKTVARVSGVPHGALAKLIYGDRARGMEPSKRIRPSTEARILAVAATLDNLGQTACVDSTGTHRRLQALVTLGWSQSQLARRIGMDATNLWGVLRRPVVHAETARKVRSLYDELWKIPPPESNQRERIAASRARNYAATRGWKPPLWWDEDEIDRPVIESVVHDLSADVDDIAIERAMRGEDVDLTKTERLEAVRRLLAVGVTKTEVARRLLLSGATVNALLAQIEQEAA